MPFKKGKSGNPKGAPKRGESWAELFNAIGNYTGEEVAALATNWAAKLKRLPKGVTLKQLVVVRAYTALLDESNARLLKEVMDRAEGKMAQVIAGDGDQPLKVIVGYERNQNNVAGASSGTSQDQE